MKELSISEIAEQQIIAISKAGAYDILSKHNQELLKENALLRNRVKYLENLIKDFANKMLGNPSSGK